MDWLLENPRNFYLGVALVCIGVVLVTWIIAYLLLLRHRRATARQSLHVPITTGRFELTDSEPADASEKRPTIVMSPIPLRVVPMEVAKQSRVIEHGEAYEREPIVPGTVPPSVAPDEIDVPERTSVIIRPLQIHRLTDEEMNRPK